MPNIDPEALQPSVLATQALQTMLPWFFLVFALTTGAQSWRRRIVGKLIVRDPGSLNLLRLLLGLIGAAVCLGFFSASGPNTGVLIFAALVAAGTALETPRPGEAAVGESGVMIGWESWTWERVTSWRLLGEHLRVDVGERWLAVRIPKAEMKDLEAFLNERLPDAVSPLR